LDEQEKQLARQVRDAQLVLRSSDLDVFSKAQLALKNNLPGQALDLLSKADAASLGQGGIVLMLDLLLLTGETRKARDLLQPELETAIGRNTYCRLQTYLAAASGDYQKADRMLERIDSGIDVPDLGVHRAPPVRALTLVVGHFLLDRAAKLQVPVGDTVETLINRCREYRFLMRLEADIAALRGMLALEAGETAKAREHLRRSLEIFDDPQGAGGLARHYLQLMHLPRPAPPELSTPAPRR
jgi:tetratricopeptide (TPR) repeat protein